MIKNFYRGFLWNDFTALQ